MQIYICINNKYIVLRKYNIQNNNKIPRINKKAKIRISSSNNNKALFELTKKL